MTLFAKYNRVNLMATIAIFIGASAAYYATLNYVLLKQVDEDLRIERNEIISYVAKLHRLPEVIKVRDQFTQFTPASSGTEKKYFSTVSTIDPFDNDKEKFRQLTFSLNSNGAWYTVVVAKSLEETHSHIRAVLLISFITIVLILATSWIINRVLLRKLWRPFYTSLEAVKTFRIDKPVPPNFEATDIEEFHFMNTSLHHLTRQAQADYLALKTFSENASHEIQTPIAIVRSKLDLLLQDEALTQRQSESLDSAYQAIQRLTTLNQHLLLLAKIEANQYGNVQPINLAAEVQKKLADFSELWTAQNLQITASVDEAMVTMNPDLANILLNNLLSNATHYNYEGGALQIELSASSLVIKNTSDSPALNKEKLFQRFYKPAQSGNSNGLGLSIIKQVCDVSGFAVRYLYDGGLHVFRIDFRL